MILKHRPSVILPDVSGANGTGTQSVLKQIVDLLYNTFKNIYDDLSNISTARVDALPTAGADFLGRFFLVTHGGAVDTLHVCVYTDATQTYLWKQVTLT